MILNEIGSHTKEVSCILGALGSREKSVGLEEAARALLEDEEEILEANSMDYERARSGGMNQGLLNRLKLTPAKVQTMAGGLLQVAFLEDPMGEVPSMKLRSNSLQIGQKYVPLGVIGVTYEARPSVVVDAFGLCFKPGNAVILKGGSDALHSSMAITRYLHTRFANAGLSKDSIQLIENTNRDTTRGLMRLNRHIGVLIPGGGAGLIETVVGNSTTPAIEMGVDNCHVYVDASADQNMTLDIIFNAKAQRIGTCSAYESLLVHRDITEKSLPLLRKRLEGKQVEVRGDEDARATEPSFVGAAEEDWGREYLDRTLSLRLVDSVDEAIHHINTYSTGHSEAIVTPDYFNAQTFLSEIDTAAAYVNASTRFTDGEKFDLGAEIDISTQKLRTRGPMDLKELTTTRYITCGGGQIR